MSTITRTEAKQQIADLAVCIRDNVINNVLVFASMDDAREAGRIFLSAGMGCCWIGGNKPILTTAADFTPKARV